MNNPKFPSYNSKQKSLLYFFPLDVMGSSSNETTTLLRSYSLENITDSEAFSSKEIYRCQRYVNEKLYFRGIQEEIGKDHSLSSFGHELRSLKFIDYIFQCNINLSLIRTILEPKKRPKVLDIGCGLGRALIDIKLLRPDATVRGIYYSSTPLNLNSFCNEPLSNLFPHMITQDSIKNIALNNLDLNKKSIEFLEDDSLSLIFSFACFRYIKDKLELLKDLWKKIERGGLVIIDLGPINFLSSEGMLSKNFFYKKSFSFNILAFKKESDPFPLDFIQVEDQTFFVPWKENFYDFGWNTSYNIKVL